MARALLRARAHCYNPVVLILISAGEASGEMYGAQLIDALRHLDPSLEFFGVGGDRMRAAGCDTVVDSKDLSVVGITEILSQVRTALDERGAKLGRKLYPSVRVPPSLEYNRQHGLDVVQIVYQVREQNVVKLLVELELQRVGGLKFQFRMPPARVLHHGGAEIDAHAARGFYGRQKIARAAA